MNGQGHQKFAISLMEHLVVPTFVIDADGRVMIWNKACERLTGVSAADMVGGRDHWRAFYDAPRPCLADLVLGQRYSEIQKLYESRGPFGFSDFGVSAENWCVMPRLGHRLYLAIDAGPIYDEAGKLTAVIETLRDITVQHTAQLELESLAARDGLTGLANRRVFDAKLIEAKLRCVKEQKPLGLLMIDIDFFKGYNDAYGHQRGDECLRLVAEAIASCLRGPNDLAARYGGEEFALILPGASPHVVGGAAERIREAVESLAIPHRGSGASKCVTASVGAAVASGAAEAESLVNAADAALYQAKRAGRNRVRLTTPAHEAA
ncbi:MAG: diguanylate cyclase [Bradyrhizobium sp.]|nr:MAG: diguanylate cyclase [Bradyrhizobium sp.]